MPLAKPAETETPKAIDLESAMHQVDESLSDVIRLLYHVLRQHEEIREALSRQGMDTAGPMNRPATS